MDMDMVIDMDTDMVIDMDMDMVIDMDIGIQWLANCKLTKKLHKFFGTRRWLTALCYHFLLE
jgi:hypothetical protein